MNAMQFPTRNRPLCRVRAHLNCSYFLNYNTRGAGVVVVSASDWHAGGPGLIHRRSKPVIFGIKTTRQLAVQCHASRTLVCLYIKLIRKSHRPQYHYSTIYLCVYRRVKYASASLDLGGKKDKTKESGTHISFRSTTSPS